MDMKYLLHMKKGLARAIWRKARWQVERPVKRVVGSMGRAEQVFGRRRNGQKKCTGNWRR